MFYKLQQYTPTNNTNPPTNVAGPGIAETDKRYPIADPMIGSKDNANVTVSEDKCFMATKKPECPNVPGTMARKRTRKNVFRPTAASQNFIHR